jgi:hypothetical protein
MNGFSKAFKIDKDALRIRTFEFAGHTFKVRVPLTIEFDLMYENLKLPNEELVQSLIDKITKKQKKESDAAVVTDDVKNNKLIRDEALNKAMIQANITAMFKFLVPEEQDFDMSTITYEMIDELFPFAIQMQITEMISETVSPNYKVTKGK